MSSNIELIALKEYFDKLREADQRAVQAALVAADRGVSAALAASEKAIVKAETAAEKRFELLNELRGGVATTEQLDALEKLIQSLEKRITLMDGRRSGLDKGWAILLAALGAVATVIAIVSRL